jgi:predicted phage tail protein
MTSRSVGPEHEGNEMPLSEQEQRLLEEMERNLYKNDADFVATVGGAGRGRPNYRAIVLGVLLAVAGAGALIGGVASQILIIGVLGFALMFVGVLVAITPSKRAASARMSGMPGPSGSAPRSAKPRGGFMDRLNERWDRRQEGRD